MTLMAIPPVCYNTMPPSSLRGTASTSINTPPHQSYTWSPLARPRHTLSRFHHPLSDPPHAPSDPPDVGAYKKVINVYCFAYLVVQGNVVNTPRIYREIVILCMPEDRRSARASSFVNATRIVCSRVSGARSSISIASSRDRHGHRILISFDLTFTI